MLGQHQMEYLFSRNPLDLSKF